MIAQHPPAPPTRHARVRLTTTQRIGIPIMAVLPVLAIAGVFGERSSTTAATSQTLGVTVQYPTRFRYRQIEPVRVTVRNRSPDALDTVFISFDTAYISRFSSVRFDPPVRAAYVVPVMNLRPGTAALVSVELWGERYGRHRGSITVRASGDSVVIPISTVVFP